VAFSVALFLVLFIGLTNPEAASGVLVGAFAIIAAFTGMGG